MVGNAAEVGVLSCYLESELHKGPNYLVGISKVEYGESPHPNASQISARYRDPSFQGSLKLSSRLATTFFC